MATLGQVVFLMCLAGTAVLATKHNGEKQSIESDSEDDDREGKRLIAELMANIMGLSSSTSSVASTVDVSKEANSNVPVPQYIQEFARSLSDMKGERTATGAEEEAEMVEKGATASVFIAETPQRPKGNSRPDEASVASVKFKVPQFDLSENISSASLRVFLHRQPQKLAWLHIDGMLDGNTNLPARTIIPTELKQPGKWFIVNVTLAMKILQQELSSGDGRRPEGEDNELEFVLSLRDGDKKSTRVLNVHSVMNLDGEYLPTLTLLKETPVARPLSIPEELQKRLWKHFRNVRRTKRSAPFPPSNDRWASASEEHCKLHRFEISKEIFEDYLLFNVISPLTLEFNICLGHCNLPLLSHSNASSNAVVRSLFQVKQPHYAVPDVQCCPIDFRPIVLLASQLQSQQKGRMAMFRMIPFNDLIATSCGCR